MGLAPRSKPIVCDRGVSRSRALTLLGLLVVTNNLTLSGLVANPGLDGWLSGKPSQMHDAYKDRVTGLRREVDRLRSMECASSGATNLRLQDLAFLQAQFFAEHDPGDRHRGEALQVEQRRS